MSAIKDLLSSLEYEETADGVTIMQYIGPNGDSIYIVTHNGYIGYGVTVESAVCFLARLENDPRLLPYHSKFFS